MGDLRGSLEDIVMLDKPPAQLTAFIHLVVPRAEIQNVMGPGIREVLAVVADQGIAVAGPWFTYHRRRPSESFDLEISVPVAAPVAAGRVKPSQLPAMRVARTIYSGGYEGLAAAWGELIAWVGASGHKAETSLWECYVVGPESSPDPATWRTELNQPLAK